MPLLSELKQYDRELKKEVLRLKDEVTESDWDAIILLDGEEDDDDNDSDGGDNDNDDDVDEANNDRDVKDDFVVDAIDDLKLLLKEDLMLCVARDM